MNKKVFIEKIFLTQDEKEKFKKICDENDVSMSYQCRQLIKQFNKSEGSSIIEKLKGLEFAYSTIVKFINEDLKKETNPLKIQQLLLTQKIYSKVAFELNEINNLF